jgi:integrase
MKVIKVALKHAARLDLLPKNPAEKIELLSNDTRERGILTPAELERLFRLEWGDERGKIAAILAASSGMRLGEITGLQIENLDFERNIIHVLHSYSAYEKRIKGTKSGKPRMIFTDPFILRMLAYLHAKNPHNNSYIFYGTEADKPVTANTMEHLTEKALADIFGEDVRASFTGERAASAKALVQQTGLAADEYIAITRDNLDTIQNAITLTHRYAIEGIRLKTRMNSEKQILRIEPVLTKRLAVFCGQAPYVFIVGGMERDTPIDFQGMEEKEGKRLTRFLGEMARRERNVSFHGFRHFFNSTIRGMVSDETLRLQTGHADAKMTDQYDHLTDDRGNQLRQAVQTKILPYIPQDGMGD